MKKYSLFINYILIGGLGVSLHILIYFFMNFFGTNYYISNSFGYISGTLLSYALNYFYNFKPNSNFFGRLIIFFLIALFGLFFSNLLLFTFISILVLNKEISIFLTLPLVLLFQFSLNRLITFR